MISVLRAAKQGKASTAARSPRSQVFPGGRERYEQTGRLLRGTWTCGRAPAARGSEMMGLGSKLGPPEFPRGVWVSRLVEISVGRSEVRKSMFQGPKYGKIHVSGTKVGKIHFQGSKMWKIHVSRVENQRRRNTIDQRAACRARRRRRTGLSICCVPAGTWTP